MYTLRTVGTNQKQTNQAIGNVYSVVDRFENYNEFCDHYKALFQVDHVKDLDPNADNFSKSCYGFVLSLQEIIPLYNDNCYYIMTESGKTFSNLSNKK